MNTEKPCAPDQGDGNRRNFIITLQPNSQYSSELYAKISCSHLSKVISSALSANNLTPLILLKAKNYKQPAL